LMTSTMELRLLCHNPPITIGRDVLLTMPPGLGHLPYEHA
jgi:hypothetical protein